MSFNVRLFGYSGIIQVGQSHAQQYSGDAVFLNEEPCLWSQILVCDGSTVVTSAVITTVPDGTQMVCVEVPDGHEIRYEVVQPGAAARTVSDSSRRGSGFFNLAWSPGYTLSIMEVVAPVAPTTWNPLDKSAGISLSGGNLIATDTVVGDVAVRATVSHAPGTGLYHVEFTVGSTYAGGDTGPGFCTAAAPLGSVGVVAANGVIVYPAGNIYFNGVVTAKAIGALSAGDVIGMELNRLTNMFWARRNNDNWFQDAAANPLTGVNGLDLSAVFAANAIFPVFAANSNGSFLRANFGATAPAFPASLGFGAW